MMHPDSGGEPILELSARIEVLGLNTGMDE